jgi:hypothetical protein
MNLRFLISGFTAGELSPKMLGQVDFAQYQFGCEILENFIVWPQGMVTRRPGIRFIAAGKTPATAIRLLPFEFSTTQAYMIEMGALYFRFYMNQGQILSAPATPYEIVHDYLPADFFEIQYSQSADIMFLAHNDYPPRSLSRMAHTSWTLTDIEFTDGPYLAPNIVATKTLALASVTVPTAKTVTGVTNVTGLINVLAVGHGLITDDYAAVEGVVGVQAANGGCKVTRIDNDNFTIQGSTFAGTYVSGGTVKKLTVMTASGFTFTATQIPSLWRHKNSTWGYCKAWYYIGSTTMAVEMKVTNSGGTATADWCEGAWSPYRGYPSVVGFYENRLFYGATTYQPQTLWGSKSGDYYNHTPGSNDDDPIAITLNSDYVNVIKWISGTKILLVGTSRGQWHISATGTNEALTPSNIKAAQETGLTSSAIMTRCDHTVLFWQQFGRNLMEVAYSLESDSYVATPLTVLAEHMGMSPIKEMAYLQEPLGSLWCIRTDGQMAVLTYERQHKVVAWYRLVTDGYFESVARIPGATRDELWVVVKRTIGGATVRYVELIDNLETYENATEDMFYVDSGLTYDSIPATSIPGLSHLTGKTVSVLADGAVHEDCLVTAGVITLDKAASVVQVGLPFTSTMKPVRFETKVQGGTIQNRRQRITTLAARFYKSYGGKFGEDLTKLEIIPSKKMGGTMDVPLVMESGDKRLQFPGSLNRDGQFYIVQDLPLPMNISMITTRTAMD